VECQKGEAEEVNENLECRLCRVVRIEHYFTLLDYPREHDIL